MLSKKYLGDYKTDYVLGPGGKIRGEASYAGKYYRFVLKGDRLQKSRKRFAVLALAQLICFVLPLFFNSCAAHTWYAVFPFAFLMLPLAFISMSVFGFIFEKQPMIREKSDKIYERGMHSLLFSLIFSAAGVLGYVIMLFLRWAELKMPGDIIHGACQALLLALSIVMFSFRKDLRTEETKAPGAVRK